MPLAKFVKDNLVLVIGVTLPLLLMAGFLAVSALPGSLTDPPKYDLVFSTQDYPPTPIPIALRLLVKDGHLMAQYTKPAGQVGNVGAWKKLFLFEVSSGRVRQLALGFPSDMASIESTREEPVASAAGLQLDTTLQAPDGYELAFGDRRGGGLLLDLFGARDGSFSPRLRKGNRSIAIPTAGHEPFAYGSAEFVGWVTGRNVASLRLAAAALNGLPSGQALP